MIEKMMTKKKTTKIEDINNVNIVLFGFDNSGKTTLCKKIAEEAWKKVPGCIVYDLHSPGPLTLQGHIDWLEENLVEVKGGDGLKPYNNITIFDRFPVIDEYVYGNVLRKKNNFKHLKTYCNEKIEIPLLFIYCRPPEEKIFNWGTREQYDGVKENAKQCLWYYDRVLDEYPSMINKTIFYDFTEGYEKTVDHVINSINEFFNMKKKIMSKRKVL